MAQQRRRATDDCPADWGLFVFSSAAGTPIDPSNFRRLVKDVAMRAGIGHLAPYDLRHTAASLLSDAGVPNRELADLLGHTTTRMVEIHYRHRLTETIDVAVGPMETILRDVDRSEAPPLAPRGVSGRSAGPARRPKTLGGQGTSEWS